MSENINEITPNEQPKSSFKKFELDIKDTIFVIAMFLSSILLSAFGIFGGFRGGFTVSAIILTVTMSIFLFTKGCKFKGFPALCLLLSIELAVNFAITSNGAVRFWSFIAFYCLTVAWLTSIVRQETNRGSIGFFCYLISPLIEGLVNLPAAIISIFSRSRETNKTVGKIIAGIALAFPLLIIIIPLLMNSDEAFSGMISIIFSKTAAIIGRSIFGIIIGFFIVSYAISLKNGEPLIKKSFSATFISPIIIISFLSMLSICYLSYLFSQLAYFFDAFRGFLPDGYEFTVANYARRGFFEMTVIAAINFAVIFICNLFSKKQNKRLNFAVNALSTFVGVFTLVIISTALSKMFLYIKSFGMTQLRITTSVFMLFLGVVFIALMLRLYIKQINVLKTAFITAAVALILLGTLNVNSIIAGYNYNAYKNGILKEVDVETIAELQDEGIPYLILLTDDENDETANLARYKLSLAYDDYYYFEKSDNGILKIEKRIYTEIGQLSASRQRAYRELEGYFEKDQFILQYKNKYIPNSEIENDIENGIW